MSHSYIRPKYHRKEMGLCLNLGCGEDHIFEGYDNIDVVEKEGITSIDLFNDRINRHYGKDQVDYIFSSHFFEHIPNFVHSPEEGNDFLYFRSFLDQLYDICKHDAIIEIVVPYPSLEMLKYANHVRVVDIQSFSSMTGPGKFLLKERSAIRKPQYHLKKYLNIEFGNKHSLRLVFQVKKQ